MATVLELGKLVKTKYPGAYDAIDDAELGKMVKQKYPGAYDQFEDIGPPNVSPEQKEPIARSAVSKTLNVIGRITSVLSDPATRKIYGPLVRQLPIPEEAKARIRNLETSKNIVYPSDVLDAAVPWLKPIEEAGYSSMGAGFRPGIRFMADVALDPLSYLSFGTETAAGRLSTLAHEAKQAGQPIKLSSVLADRIAQSMGAPKPSPRVIKDYLKKIGTPGKTLTEQVARGEKSLVSLQVPGTSVNIPLATGKTAANLIKPLSAARRGMIGSKLETAIRNIFSNKSGNPDFDVLIQKYRDLAFHRAGLQIQEGKVLNQNLEDLTRELGIPREELNKQITSLVESVIPTTKKLSIQKYGRLGFQALDEYYTDKIVDHKVLLDKARRTYQDALKIGDTNVMAQAQDAINDATKHITNYNAELNKIHGRYSPPKLLDPAEQKIVNDIKEKNVRQYLEEVTSGVRLTPLLADVEYMAHIMTPEAREILAKTAKDKGLLPPRLSQKEMSEFLANSVRREFSVIKPEVIDAWQNIGFVSNRDAKVLKGKNGFKKLDELLKDGKITDQHYTDAVHTLSIDEVNKLGQEGKINFLGNQKINEVFHTDPVYATTIRGMRGARAQTAAEFFTEMRKRGLALPDAQAPSNWVNVRQVELEGHKVSPEIARVLNRWDDFHTHPEELSKALKLYDRLYSLQKLWTLAPFPAYHTMNMVGNFWNNFLAGVTNPKRYVDAVKVRMGGSYNFTDIYGHTWDSPSLLKRMRELGVVDKGWYGSDVARSIKQEIEGGKWLTLSSRNKLLRAGLKFGKEIENNARAAHFIDMLHKGMNAEQAALSVKKFLFDYGDLSNTERQLFNRVFFFYIWTRKNIPLQLESLIHQPWKFSLPFKAKYEIEKEVYPGPEKHLAEWMKENFPIRVKYNKKTGNYTYFMLGRWLPAIDLLKLAHIHEIAANMVTPIGKELVQQLWNYDWFMKRPIEDIPGQKDVLHIGPAIFHVSKKTLHAAKMIRLLNEIDKLSDPDKDLYTKMLGFLTGKTYEFNPTTATMTDYYRINEEVKNLEQALRKEYMKKPVNQKEVNRILQMIQDKVKEY